MKWNVHVYDPKTQETTTHVKEYPGTKASMADAPAVVAKASRDFKTHMKYILAVPHHGAKRAHSTRHSGEESFASLHRKAVRENLRAELDRALDAIKRATHVADYHGKIHAYGSEAEMHAFADGLRGVKVRPITAREQKQEALSKRQKYGNP
jgi:hypothetical protein